MNVLSIREVKQGSVYALLCTRVNMLALCVQGVLSSRWKSSEDEVIALVSWIDGIGNKKKGYLSVLSDILL